jgi:hypothetical protein
MTWSLFFDERRGSDYYRSLPFYWGDSSGHSLTEPVLHTHSLSYYSLLPN